MVAFEHTEPRTSGSKLTSVDQQCPSSSQPSVEEYPQNGREGSASKAILQAPNSFNTQRKIIRHDKNENMMHKQKAWLRKKWNWKCWSKLYRSVSSSEKNLKWFRNNLPEQHNLIVFKNSIKIFPHILMQKSLELNYQEGGQKTKVLLDLTNNEWNCKPKFKYRIQ